MPMRPPGPCSVPTCPQRAVRRGLCAQHAEASARRYREQHPDLRPSASQRGYDVKWRRVRAQYLKLHPACVWPGCTEKATDVDHVLSLANGGTHAHANLQGFCHRHHSKKTALVDGSFGNARR